VVRADVMWTIVTPSLLVYLSATQSCAVCSQCGCSPVSRCTLLSPDGPSLAAGAAMHPIQTVRAHVLLLRWSSTTILDRAGNARWRHCPSSSAVGVIYRSRHASYTSINNRRRAFAIADHFDQRPRAWNSQPPDVCSSATYNTSKKKP